MRQRRCQAPTSTGRISGGVEAAGNFTVGQVGEPAGHLDRAATGPAYSVTAWRSGGPMKLAGDTLWNPHREDAHDGQTKTCSRNRSACFQSWYT